MLIKLFASCIVMLAVLNVCVAYESVPNSAHLSAIKSRKASKPESDHEGMVQQLISFFEITNNQPFKVVNAVRKEILTAPIAMHMLRDKISDRPLEFRCNNYYKLIKSPIKTSRLIDNIAADEWINYELLSFKSNLIEGLHNERKFDSLSRLISFVETLETEQLFGRSLYDVKMQDELLNCVNYYVYRHQNALNTAVDYIQNNNERLRPLLERPKTSNETELLLVSAMNDVEAEEKVTKGRGVDNEQNWTRWLDAMKVLAQRIIDANFVIPSYVEEFVAKRATELDNQEATKQHLEQLMAKAVEYEHEHELVGDEQQLEQAGESDDIVEHELAPVDQSYVDLLTKIESIGQQQPGQFRQIVNEFLSHKHRNERIDHPDIIAQYKDEIRRMMEEEARAKAEAEKRALEAAEEAKKKKKISFSMFSKRKN